MTWAPPMARSHQMSDEAELRLQFVQVIHFADDAMADQAREHPRARGRLTPIRANRIQKHLNYLARYRHRTHARLGMQLFARPAFQPRRPFLVRTTKPLPVNMQAPPHQLVHESALFHRKVRSIESCTIRG